MKSSTGSASARGAVRPGDLGVSPRVSRWRARGGLTAWILVSLLLTVGVVLLVRLTQNRGWLVLILLGAFLPIAAPVLCQARVGTEVHHGPGRTLLTARTLTGYRTVDLSRLRRVHRVLIPGRPTSLDMLVVTDAHGVRLGLQPWIVQAALNRTNASLRQAASTTVPRISYRARRALEGQGIVWDFLVTELAILLWVVAATLVCISAAVA